MPEMSRWMSLRSNGVMNVECRTETVSCVILSALRSMSPMRWISSARRTVSVVVLHQFDDGIGALDDQRAVAIEQREEPRLARHQGG